LTTELDRIKILEGKISQVVEYVNKLGAENEKLRQQLKEFKTEKKELEEQGKKVARLDEELKKSEGERETVKARIEALIGQIDQLGI
jgi:FtsZ-binding cell division protein ZapB